MRNQQSILSKVHEQEMVNLKHLHRNMKILFESHMKLFDESMDEKHFIRAKEALQKYNELAYQLDQLNSKNPNPKYIDQQEMEARRHEYFVMATKLEAAEERLDEKKTNEVFKELGIKETRFASNAKARDAMESFNESQSRIRKTGPEIDALREASKAAMDAAADDRNAERRGIKKLFLERLKEFIHTVREQGFRQTFVPDAVVMLFRRLTKPEASKPVQPLPEKPKGILKVVDRSKRESLSYTTVLFKADHVHPSLEPKKPDPTAPSKGP